MEEIPTNLACVKSDDRQNRADAGEKQKSDAGDRKDAEVTAVCERSDAVEDEQPNGTGLRQHAMDEETRTSAEAICLRVCENERAVVESKSSQFKKDTVQLPSSDVRRKSTEGPSVQSTGIEEQCVIDLSSSRSSEEADRRPPKCNTGEPIELDTQPAKVVCSRSCESEKESSIDLISLRLKEEAVKRQSVCGTRQSIEHDTQPAKVVCSRSCESRKESSIDLISSRLKEKAVKRLSVCGTRESVVLDTQPAKINCSRLCESEKQNSVDSSFSRVNEEAVKRPSTGDSREPTELDTQPTKAISSCEPEKQSSVDLSSSRLTEEAVKRPSTGDTREPTELDTRPTKVISPRLCESGQQSKADLNRLKSNDKTSGRDVASSLAEGNGIPQPQNQPQSIGQDTDRRMTSCNVPQQVVEKASARTAEKRLPSETNLSGEETCVLQTRDVPHPSADGTVLQKGENERSKAVCSRAPSIAGPVRRSSRDVPQHSSVTVSSQSDSSGPQPNVETTRRSSRDLRQQRKSIDEVPACSDGNRERPEAKGGGSKPKADAVGRSSRRRSVAEISSRLGAVENDRRPDTNSKAVRSNEEETGRRAFGDGRRKTVDRTSPDSGLHDSTEEVTEISYSELVNSRQFRYTAGPVSDNCMKLVIKKEVVEHEFGENPVYETYEEGYYVHGNKTHRIRYIVRREEIKEEVANSEDDEESNDNILMTTIKEEPFDFHEELMLDDDNPRNEDLENCTTGNVENESNNGTAIDRTDAQQSRAAQRNGKAKRALSFSNNNDKNVQALAAPASVPEPTASPPTRLSATPDALLFQPLIDFDVNNFPFKKQRKRRRTKSELPELPASLECTICMRKLASRQSYEHHMGTHARVKVLPPTDCSFCQKTLSSKQALDKHINSHHTFIKKFVCEMCDKVFYERGNLYKHVVNTHFALYKYTCDICGKSFKKKSYLRTHVTIHMDMRRHACDQCGKSYLNKCDLQLHLDSHVGVCRFKCDVCGKALYNGYTLQKHMNLHTRMNLYPCSLCDKQFAQKGSLREHQNVHTGKKHTCGVCGAAFHYVNGYRRHMRTHEGKQQECDICKKRFQRKCYLKKHMTTHFGLEQYHCDFCDKKFIDKSDYGIHMNRHTRAVEYPCDFCKKVFYNKSYLNMHLTMHNGSRKNVCVVCDKNFMKRTLLLRHMKIHEGTNKIPCEVCDRELGSPTSWKRHLWNVHRINKYCS